MKIVPSWNQNWLTKLWNNRIKPLKPIPEYIEGEVVPINAKHIDCYIVPCMLKKIPNRKEFNEYVGHTMDPKSKTPVLCFVFKDIFMPASVFHRLLAACIHEWEIETESDNMP